MPITTVGEMIDELQEHDRNLPLRLAVQPGHAIEHTIAGVVAALVTPDHSGSLETEVVYVGAGDQVGCLPRVVSDELGW